VRKGRPPRYGPGVVEVLWRIWKVAEQPCGKRLKALLPGWLPHYEAEHGGLPRRIRAGVLGVSAAQIDRLPAPRKARTGHHGRCGTKPGGLLKTQGHPTHPFLSCSQEAEVFFDGLLIV
jgi:hypothetical protein